MWQHSDQRAPCACKARFCEGPLQCAASGLVLPHIPAATRPQVAALKAQLPAEAQTSRRWDGPAGRAAEGVGCPATAGWVAPSATCHAPASISAASHPANPCLCLYSPCHRRGLLVDEHLRVVGTQGTIYCVGDAAVTGTTPQTALPPTAQVRQPGWLSLPVEGPHAQAGSLGCIVCFQLAAMLCLPLLNRPSRWLARRESIWLPCSPRTSSLWLRRTALAAMAQLLAATSCRCPREPSASGEGGQCLGGRMRRQLYTLRRGGAASSAAPKPVGPECMRASSLVHRRAGNAPRSPGPAPPPISTVQLPPPRLPGLPGQPQGSDGPAGGWRGLLATCS